MGPMPRLLSEITSNGEAAFPWKLHRVLEEAERCGFSDIVSWQGNRAFKVHDPKNFEKSIMKKYFNQTRYKSFQRQLNIYGFERITIGADIGSYTHHLLVRGKPNICRFMIRTKVKNKGSKTMATRAPRSQSEQAKRSSVTSTRSEQMQSNIVRSISCPGVSSASRKHSLGFAAPQIENNYGPNDLFRPDDRIQSIRLNNNTMRDFGIHPKRKSLKSTIEDDFTSEVFSTNTNNNTPFQGDFQSGAFKNYRANGTVDAIDVSNNSESTCLDQSDDLTPLRLCDDIIGLGNVGSNNNTFQQSPQFSQSDLEEQRRRQECELLQLQIQQLQNRISNLNKQGRCATIPEQQTAPKSNPNYLCNGVAAIEPDDHQLHLVSDNSEEMLLNPTPIQPPGPFISMNANIVSPTQGPDIRRSISFNAFANKAGAGNIL